MNESKRYDALDGVRVLAMTGILVMHVLANLSYRDELATLYSYIMYFERFTSLFMMVSAFSVSCGYYKKIQSGFSNIEKFYSKRYAKILPFFAFITLIDVLLSFSKESIFEGFANITLVFGLIPHESISVIGVGWTLGVIFVFYLLYPFVVYLMKNRIRFCLSYIATLIYAFVVNDYFGLGKVDFLFCACYFMGGAWLFLNKEKIEQKGKRAYLLLAIIGLSALYYICAFKLKWALNIVQYILFLIICMYAIVVSNKKTLLSNKIVGFLSTISLEIYLCHMVAYRIVEKLHLMRVFNNAVASYIFVCALVFVCAVIGSILFQKVYRLAYDKYLKRSAL